MKSIIRSTHCGVAIALLALLFAGCSSKEKARETGAAGSTATGSGAEGSSAASPGGETAAAATPSDGDSPASSATGAAASESVDPGFQADGTEENLKAFFVSLQEASERGDIARAAAFARSMLPTEAALKKAFRDDAPPEMATKILETLEQIVPEDNTRLANMTAARPDWTEVVVHSATTEQIASGAPEASAFPAEAKKMAEEVLRPGITFYEVERRAPGTTEGNQLHLIFFDGTNWVMLGQPWRML